MSNGVLSILCLAVLALIVYVAWTPAWNALKGERHAISISLFR